MNELLWAVQVRPYETEQLRPLDKTLFNSPPLLAGEECGDDVERPGSRVSLGVRIDVVGHAIFAQDLLDFVPTATQLCWAKRIEGTQGVSPVRTYHAWG